LTIQHRRTRLRLASLPDADDLATHRVHPFPHPLHAQQLDIMDDCLPWRHFLPQYVEKRVHGFALRRHPRTAAGLKHGVEGVCRGMHPTRLGAYRGTGMVRY
jgi:hypothetical protein